MGRPRLGEFRAVESQQPGKRARGVSPAVGCLSALLIAVVGAILLLIVLSVALRGEARFSKGDLGEVRLWLIRETANQGLALSTTRIVSGRERSGEVCVRTTARFLMLKSAQEVEDVTFCECFEREGETWASKGECPAQD